MDDQKTMDDKKADVRKQMLTAVKSLDSVSMSTLSVVLLGDSDARRKSLTTALGGSQAQVVRQSALPTLDSLPALLGDDCDVLIVDLAESTERALDLLEAACGLQSSLTVMAYGRLSDPELLVRCMRAGAREFLSEPLSPASVTDALIRASVRRDEVRRTKKVAGKCLAFVGAKGGSGVTTLASNFAVALARESGQSVVFVDLDLRLGDAALDLGLSSEFSTLDALQNEARLDSELVSKLLVRHESGLQVLAAPDEHNVFHPTQSGVMKLIQILRNDFAWVVVDAGTHYNSYGQSLFELAEKVYLITQISVTELRNSNRFITALFTGDAARKLEVVLNRFAPRAGEIDDLSINKALTVSPAWRIPSDYAAVRAAQNAATALVMKDGAISRILTSMARTACGKTAEEIKKRRFGLFG
jgi:pilus assembly protein CpaE